MDLQKWQTDLQTQAPSPNEPSAYEDGDPAGFNDVTRVPNCRNDVPVRNGGVDMDNQYLLFMRIVLGARHQAGVPDVYFLALRINRLNINGRMEFEPFNYAFMR
ncbi:hypothetical protein BC938DRAFT_475478 [Jimgerdemannia flammicorona]|uniref:Uncharacterized protein n=1 Tax=Jimgerdemannia flammicorona TaxID=994334 RepID=A0A433PTW1_9FUNG|nr:hypothetical protein BC938DRAFT_475478 [Jimgerdemannia flammicorona]